MSISLCESCVNCFKAKYVENTETIAETRCLVTNSSTVTEAEVYEYLEIIECNRYERIQ